MGRNSLESNSSDSFDSSEMDSSTNNEHNNTHSENDNSNITHSENDNVMNDSSFESVKIRDGLTVFYTNADNLLNKIDELKVRLQLKTFDALVVTEVYPKTGKSDDIQLSELQIDGYNIYRSNVESHSRGVIIYVSEQISSNIILDLTNHPFSESVWVEIRWNNTDNLLLGGIYRSPQSDSDNNNQLLEIISAATSKNFTHTMIVGDFNIPEIDWNLWTTSKSENHFSYLFLENLRDNFLEQPITKPTRWLHDTPGNVLDLCLIDNKDIVKEMDITTRLGNSDHLCIEIELIFPVLTENISTKRRNFYRGDYKSANSKLTDINWEVMEEMNVEQCWTFFSENVKAVINDTIPIHKDPKKKPKPPWMDHFCLKLVEQKYRAWKRYTFSRNRIDYLDYCKIRNKVSRSVRYAKRKYERGISLEAKENPKSFWKFVKSKTKTRSGIGDLKNDSGEWISDDHEKANELNSFFSSVFTKHENDNMPEFEPIITSTVCDITITKQKVESMLKVLNVSKSTGPDEFHPRFLKETAESIALPVTILFNKSLNEGSIPQEWKLANVTCIHKSGDKTSASNYRPISITSILCRMLERIIKTVLMDHCNDNHIFSDSQYGFRQRRGCILQLLKVFDDWSKFIDSDTPVDAVFLDFRKAFDCVPHKRLLMKIEKLGITGNLLKWITDFLTNRQQRVLINGISSEWTEVSSGVPQGSVLGPILFILFVNDLPSEVNSYCKLFADDAKLYKDLENLQDFEMIQNDIDRLCQWTIKWLMFFNVNKCKILHIGKENPNFEYQMEDKDGTIKNLTVVNCEKDLGIYVQDNLKFDQHISITVNRANRLVGLIKRAFSYLDEETLLVLHKTLIRPILDYGNLIWFPTLKKDIRAIENVQRRITKILPELSNLSYEERLQRLSLSTLMYRRNRMDMIQVFKIVQNIDDISMNGLFEFSDTQTRGNSMKLKKPRALKTFRMNSFCVRTINKWNALPNDIVNSKTVLCFKTAYDRLMGNNKYTTQEIY